MKSTTKKKVVKTIKLKMQTGGEVQTKPGFVGGRPVRRPPTK